jgi:hypothetical protein
VVEWVVTAVVVWAVVLVVLVLVAEWAVVLVAEWAAECNSPHLKLYPKSPAYSGLFL